jgi:hypothetical protein
MGYVFRDDHTMTRASPTRAAKQVTHKTRKSISIGSGRRFSGSGGDLDDDDDFTPTKKAAAAKSRKVAGGVLRA